MSPPALKQRRHRLPESHRRRVQTLLERLSAQDARIQQLESKVQQLSAATPPAANAPDAIPVSNLVAPAVPPAGLNTDSQPDSKMDMGGHSMDLPGGGPTLRIRGFFDFNFGVGSIANALVYPISDGGCGICGNPVTPAHTAFQAGEFDLLFASRISDHLNFLAEVVMGPAAESFLARQCQLALKTDAASITPPHFKELGSWVEVAACRFIEQAKALEMGKRIAALPAS